MRPDSVKKKHLIVPLMYRAPFGVPTPAVRKIRPAGETILQMIESMKADLPEDFLERGEVRINDEAYPPQLWGVLRPKATSSEKPIAVTLHYAPGKPGGGGSSTTKTVVSLVAAFALIVLTYGIGTFGLPALGIAAGSVAAHALAIGVGLAGSLAIAALTPPPTLQNATGGINAAPQSDNNTDQAQPASASGNVLTPGGAIPRVIGTIKVFPPLAGEPIVELIGDDEFVEANFVLNGPHLLEDIRINGTSIDDQTEDVEFETREGFLGDDPVTLVTRQGRTVAPQLTLSVHRVNPSTQNLLAHPTAPDTDLPVWHAVASPARKTQDEIWMHFLLPNGISINGSTSTDVAIPLRIRIRKRGDINWINLPEVHISDSTLQQRRRAVLLQWRTRGDVVEPVPAKSGFYYANVNVPGQTTLPATNGWVANSYFVDSTAAVDYLNTGTEGTTRCQNMCLFDNRVEFYLDENVFPKGVYEIQVKRGTAYQVSSFTPSTYVYSGGPGGVQDFFAYTSAATPAIPMSRSNLADSMGLMRVLSIRNEYPILKPGLAIVSMKARNRDLSNVSVLASGYVRDWDGVDWNTWTTTSNPAPHYRDIFCGQLQRRPLPRDLFGDSDCVAWRALCNLYGWKCDLIVDDFRTNDVAAVLASCGYARNYQNEIYSVTVDKDTSGDVIHQIFSRRNVRDVSWQRGFPDAPDGFIVNFTDKDSDYQPGQEFVYQRDRAIPTTGNLETVTYAGLVDRAAVIARAQFDLDQANLRGTFYKFTTDAEGAVICRKGDLVGFQHDTLSKQCGDGILKSKTVVAGNITALTIDSTIPITNEPLVNAVVDMTLVNDVTRLGVTTGISLRRSDGSGTITTHALSNSTGDSNVLTLATPIADDVDIEGLDDTAGTIGAHITAGDLGVEFKRVKISEVAPAKDMQATITLVDEAQELVRYAA